MIIALVGPPGSGKTYLGRLLGSSLGYDFPETEKLLLDRYGSRELFLKHKAAALTELERELRSRAESSAVPVVIEATGLSDGPMLKRFGRDLPLRLVKVYAPRDLCIARVQSRERGRNLSNDPDETSKFHDFWLREVAPRYEFDLSVVNDGTSDSRILSAVAALVTPTNEIEL